jgi:UDP-glucuronate 4-epimerase
MRVFVTGAAGFIASRLSKALLARGDQVIGLDNFDPYYDRVHKDRHLRDLLVSPNFTFETGDLRDATALRKLFETHQPTHIAHLAGMAAVRYSVQHPLLYGEVNVQGSVHVLDAARFIGTPQVVMASTGSVYGSDTPVPFNEQAHADRPLAPYPASKRAMEIMAHSYHNLWKLPVTVLRFFNVYGPHGRPDMMPWQWATSIARGDRIILYNGGHLKRDWTFVDDIVAGFIAALEKPLGFEIINLGCACPVENLEFVRILEELLERPANHIDAPAPASEPTITYADIAKARELLGYAPKTNVAEGLRQFVKWLRSEKLL